MPVGAEPREDDRDAAADRPARGKSAVGAGEEDRPLDRRLPGGQVGSLQVKLARDAVERDRGLDQPVFRFDEIENAGNAEFGTELLGLHRSFLFPKIIIADCGASAPSRNSARRGVGIHRDGRRCSGQTRLRQCHGLPCRGANYWGDAPQAHCTPYIYCRNACDGRRRRDAGWRVV
jgi:hypothetical protein